MENRGLAAVILAAGYSSRMGEFKALMRVGGRSALKRIVDTLHGLGVTEIILVTGYERERLQDVIKSEGLIESYNPLYDQGMFSSMQAGIKTFLDRGSPADILIWPVDCPVVRGEAVELLLRAREGNPESFAVPCYEGKKGHPLVMPGTWLKDILAYEGSGGLKGFMEVANGNSAHIKLLRVETGDEGVVLDMDTKEGYEEILEYVSHKQQGLGWESQGFHFKIYQPQEDQAPKYDASMFWGRIFLVRHGETEQHEEPIFIGQLDVPLNEGGRRQALLAGIELAGCGPDTDEIHVSDLSRTMETAELLGSALRSGADGTAMRLLPEPDFREMSLGKLEGRSISSFKAENPKEYRSRGEELLQYKTGNHSENFYDLQYRVMKRFRKLLAERTALGCPRDLIIVTHDGVIKVLISNLLGYSLEETVKMKIPKGSIIKMNIEKIGGGEK